MPRYVVLYRFTEQGAKNIRTTVSRARENKAENERRGFKVQAMLWTQGPYDLLTIVDAPSEEQMMGAMMNVVGAGNVSSTTMRAFDENEMAGIIRKLGSGATGRAAASTSRATTKPRAMTKSKARKK
jgi:uncharacterized protein with GYD domain